MYVCVCVWGVVFFGGGVEARHVLTNRLVQHPDGVLLLRADD